MYTVVHSYTMLPSPPWPSRLGHGGPVDVRQLHPCTGDATGRLPWKEALPHGQGVGRVLGEPATAGYSWPMLGKTPWKKTWAGCQ